MWSTLIRITTPAYVMTDGVERTAQFTRVNAILTVWLPTIVMDPKTAIVTTVRIMHSSMIVTTVFVSKTGQV